MPTFDNVAATVREWSWSGKPLITDPDHEFYRQPDWTD